MNRKIAWILIIIGIVAISIFSGCLFNQAEKLYQEGQELQRSSEYKNAIAKYNIILTNFTTSDYAFKATEDIAECYYNWGLQLQQDKQYNEALIKYNTVLSDYPTTIYAPKAEEAIKSIPAKNLYKFGSKCQQEKGYDEAIKIYQIIIDKYPESEFTSKAEEAIILSEVAKIADTEHGTIPKPTVAGRSDFVNVVYEVTNDAGQKMELFFVGPIIKYLSLEANDTKTIELIPGTYKVAARVEDPTVTPFYKDAETFDSGYRYTSRFYIETTISGIPIRPIHIQKIPKYTPMIERLPPMIVRLPPKIEPLP